MTRAKQYVNHMYSLYDGRAAVTVGVNSDSNYIHPFVFEDTCKVPIGLIALSADGILNPLNVCFRQEFSRCFRVIRAQIVGYCDSHYLSSWY